MTCDDLVYDHVCHPCSCVIVGGVVASRLAWFACASPLVSVGSDAGTGLTCSPHRRDERERRRSIARAEERTKERRRRNVPLSHRAAVSFRTPREKVIARRLSSVVRFASARVSLVLVVRRSLQPAESARRGAVRHTTGTTTIPSHAGSPTRLDATRPAHQERPPPPSGLDDGVGRMRVTEDGGGAQINPRS